MKRWCLWPGAFGPLPGVCATSGVWSDLLADLPASARRGQPCSGSLCPPRPSGTRPVLAKEALLLLWQKEAWLAGPQEKSGPQGWRDGGRAVEPRLRLGHRPQRPQEQLPVRPRGPLGSLPRAPRPAPAPGPTAPGGMHPGRCLWRRRSGRGAPGVGGGRGAHRAAPRRSRPPGRPGAAAVRGRGSGADRRGGVKMDGWMDGLL